MEELTLFYMYFSLSSSARFMRASWSGFCRPFFHGSHRRCFAAQCCGPWCRLIAPGRPAEPAVDSVEERSRPGMGGSPASVGDCGLLWSRPHLAKIPFGRDPLEPRIFNSCRRFSFRVFLFRFAFGAIARRRATSGGHCRLWAMGWPTPAHGDQGPHPHALETPVKNIPD